MWAIVTPFVQVGTYPTRNFATLDRYSYGRRLLGLQSRACTPSFNLPAPGRRHTLYVHFVFAECCVLLNSRSHRFFATPLGSSVRVHLLGAYLLPKLRYQFAEFLLLSSLKRLRILISRTSVGLRYGRQ